MHGGGTPAGSSATASPWPTSLSVTACIANPSSTPSRRSTPAAPSWWPTALLPTAVEELIRYDPPLQLFERTAYDDVEIGGVTVGRGQKIAALLGSANRDPSVFAGPSAPDVGRDPNPHLGFGAGIHFCLGAPLARLELMVSVPTLLRRLPRMELAEEPAHQPNFVIRGLRSLRVRW